MSKQTILSCDAVVLGLFETGLGVIRSLAREGFSVLGIDCKKDIAWYSKYVSPLLCPHPLHEDAQFLAWMEQTFSEQQKKKPIFITSDDFLSAFSKHRHLLSRYFLFNLPEHGFLNQVTDKYQQYLLTQKAGISVPKTWLLSDPRQLQSLDLRGMNHPLIIKGAEVNSWRAKIGGSVKGFKIETVDQLTHKASEILGCGVPVIIQEIIEGPDTNHYKYCAYISKSGDTLAEFTLQKIRQNPIHFGVGAVVESIHDEALMALGRELFKGIGFKGVGSAEFKRDDRDGQLKLIEINPRYWQQNALTTACGINFPYINHLDLMGEIVEPKSTFIPGIKWVNRYMDFDSFMAYRREGSLSFRQWRQSLKGPKVYSDFMWTDPLPLLYEFGFGKKLVRIPWYLLKKLKEKS